MSMAGRCIAASTASGMFVGPGMLRNSRPLETVMVIDSSPCGSQAARYRWLLSPEDRLDLAARHCVAHPGESALVLHLARALQERRERKPVERAADADALHAGRRQILEHQRGITVSHHDVHRLRHRRR